MGCGKDDRGKWVFGLIAGVVTFSGSPLGYATAAKRENGAHHPADSPRDRAYHSACTRLIRRASNPACAEPDPANVPNAKLGRRRGGNSISQDDSQVQRINKLSRSKLPERREGSQRK